MNYRYTSCLFSFFCVLLLLTFQLCEAKVMIFAHYFGQPEFVKYQVQFFKKNMLDEYEFVVFEDSARPEVSNAIRQECEKYGVRYIHIPRSVFDNPVLPITSSYIELHNGSFECAVATQYIYDNYVVPSQDICLILDNDIFLLSPFSIENYLKKAAFAYHPWQVGTPPTLVTYMLPNFLILNPSRMSEKNQLNFNMGEILGHRTDSGGFTYYYLRNNFSNGTSVSVFHLYELKPNESTLKDRFKERYPLLFGSEEWRSHFFIAPDTFLHIRMGSNWSLHPRYTDMHTEIAQFFSELLQQ